jgi:hypothetical protein
MPFGPGSFFPQAERISRNSLRAVHSENARRARTCAAKCPSRCQRLSIDNSSRIANLQFVTDCQLTIRHTLSINNFSQIVHSQFVTDYQLTICHRLSITLLPRGMADSNVTFSTPSKVAILEHSHSSENTAIWTVLADIADDPDGTCHRKSGRYSPTKRMSRKREETRPRQRQL